MNKTEGTEDSGSAYRLSGLLDEFSPGVREQIARGREMILYTVM